MRNSLLVVFVAGTGIAVAAFALRTSEVRAADSDQLGTGNIAIDMKDPGYREQKRAQIRSHLAETGVELAKDLDLTPSELSELVDLETEFQMGVYGSFVPSGPGKRPDPVASQASVAKQRELRIKLEADIVAALGAEKAQQFRDYVKSQPARQQVNQLQASLQLAGYPMTSEQSKSLIAVVATEQERLNSETAAFRVQLKNGGGANQTLDTLRAADLERNVQENERIVEGATPILSPAQLSALQQMLADDIARIRRHQQAHTSTQ
jgi:hypothetical protein